MKSAEGEQVHVHLRKALPHDDDDDNDNNTEDAPVGPNHINEGQVENVKMDSGWFGVVHSAAAICRSSSRWTLGVIILLAVVLIWVGSGVLMQVPGLIMYLRKLQAFLIPLFPPCILLCCSLFSQNKTLIIHSSWPTSQLHCSPCICWIFWGTLIVTGKLFPTPLLPLTPFFFLCQSIVTFMDVKKGEWLSGAEWSHHTNGFAEWAWWTRLQRWERRWL